MFLSVMKNGPQPRIGCRPDDNTEPEIALFWHKGEVAFSCIDKGEVCSNESSFRNELCEISGEGTWKTEDRGGARFFGVSFLRQTRN